MCLNLAAQSAEENKVLTHGTVLQRAIISSVEDTVVMDIDTDYAEYMALLDNCKDSLQESTDLLCKYAAQAGLFVNAKKTEAMAIARNTSLRPYALSGCQIPGCQDNYWIGHQHSVKDHVGVQEKPGPDILLDEVRELAGNSKHWQGI